MEITTIGIDLAKSVFAVSGADSSGRVVMRLKAPERKSLIERPALAFRQPVISPRLVISSSLSEDSRGSDSCLSDDEIELPWMVGSFSPDDMH